jgi:lysophospholipase
MSVGRGEFLEKYLDVISDLQHAGWGVLIFEWRGQGLSERDRGIPYGHVRRFDEYQLDIEAVIEPLSEMAGPFRMLSHSMGALIASRALAEGPLADVIERAVFSAPMYGLKRPWPLNVMIPFTMRFAAAIGFGRYVVPGGTAKASYEVQPFKGNNLTSDGDRYRSWADMLQKHPDLRLGAPTIAWLVAAYDEMTTLLDAPVPQMPLLCIVGDRERVVSVSTILGQLERMGGATLLRVPDALHEPLMEREALSKPVMERVLTFLDGEV